MWLNNDRKNMYKTYLFLLIASFVYFGCSPSQETMNEEETKPDDVYVFDEIPADTVQLQSESAVEDSLFLLPPSISKYYIQLGAFTTKEKANVFASSSRKTLKKEVFVKFSPDVELFVVHLPAFNTREEAEKLRNELWKKKEFQDAFILTIEETEK